MWFHTLNLVVYVLPLTWAGFCLFALLFHRRLRGRPRIQKTAQVLFLVVCFLGIGELAAGWALRDVQPPSSYVESRNPHFLRDWVAYTEPPPGPKEGYRAIVISNSQGFLRERKEGELSYPARLEERLRATGFGAQAEVLNWSVPGCSGRELVVLAARAAAHQPDAIFLVSYNNDFHPGWSRRRLASIRNDVLHLAYLPEVRSFLPETFLKRHRAFDGGDWLNAHSKLKEWRSRNIFLAETWTFLSHEPGPHAKLHTFDLSPDVAPEMLEDFLAAAHAGTADPAVRIVSMPLNPEQFRGFDRAQRFSEVAAEVAAGWPGTQVLDATAEYPVEMFYGGRHMRPEAHELFADYLMAHLPLPAPRD